MEPLWSQAGATSGKRSEPRNLVNKPKPLPWVATCCQSERMVRRRSSEGLVAYVPSGLVKNGASEFERVTPNQHVWWSDDFSPVSERRLLQTARSETPIY